MAKLTFTVTGVNPGPNNTASVSFQVTSEGEAGVGVRQVTAINLTFPRDIGKEFELDDTYSLEIAPKPESGH